MKLLKLTEALSRHPAYVNFDLVIIVMPAVMNEIGEEQKEIDVTSIFFNRENENVINVAETPAEIFNMLRAMKSQNADIWGDP